MREPYTHARCKAITFFFEPLLWQILNAIRRCLGRASQNVWVYSDQTSRCRCDLLSTAFAENCSGTEIFVTFLICEASAFVETSMFSNIFDASAALSGDGYAKGPWHHVRHGIRGQSRHRQQREAIEGDQVSALGARWHGCWAGTTARRRIQRRHRRQVVSHTRSSMGTFAHLG